ncbi:DUF1376 domain-containing protein [Salinarimonas soli]|uniref:DUF1376 domain-containing protein n=1 Tax=Salinarimonas soli TaxID=1638099 RepID=UPI001AED47AC|nr:DUF1376 domain-containing protein [Salinarimonas soli]
MTEPLVPAHVDLRDFAFMPLEVARLRDSAIVDQVSGEEFRAAILLWCASWHQLPAGSLPDDDRQLAKFAGYGRVVSEWLKVKDGALYGFVRCSDGRLYHPVIAEKAVEAWEKKHEYQERVSQRSEQARAAAEARWGKKDPETTAAAKPTQPEGEETAKPAAPPSSADANAHDEPEQCERNASAMPKGRSKGQGEVRDREKETRAPERAAAARAGEGRGSDELGPWLRSLVGQLPVLVDPNIGPILALIDEGLTRSDIEAGIAAAIEKSHKKPRCWADFDGWIRRAAKDRLAAAPAGTVPPKPVDPAVERRGRLAQAKGFVRDKRWSDSWGPRRGEPGCVVSDELWAQADREVAAEAAAARERASGSNGSAARH